MLNLKYYNGQNSYSDGDELEESILNALKAGDMKEAFQEPRPWPVTYHFSPMRRNLLEWLPFEKTASVLEIGGGCGALTGLLCEKCEHVTALELSKRRAEIIVARHGRYEGRLEVIAGNFKEVPLERKYNYVTLIGVLEYAESFEVEPENDKKEHDSYIGFLKKIRELLLPGGQLIIAIENQFGLKYFAGAKEDHAGKAFVGIEGYPGSPGFRTFGREKLKSLLSLSGYSDLMFYYPYPDYKFASKIFTDARPPTIEDLDAASANPDSERYILFNEQKAFRDIIENGMFGFFANSFLITAKCEP